MGVVFYNIFLALFGIGVRAAALFSLKPRKWVQGRQQIFDRLRAAIPPGEKLIWMHCASLGEFEQGRPLLEKLKARYPDHKILLTFFSPSGYEIRKNYPGADWIFYLPMDGPMRSKKFLDIVNPSLAIFVKYEFWYYYLTGLQSRKIPLLLVSGIFREQMGFFKWYGQFQRKMLRAFTHLFVQNNKSKNLLASIGLADRTSVTGDTRFDRVIDIAEAAAPIEAVDRFLKGERALVAGSTWPADEAVLQESLKGKSLKLIIAPHEIHTEHIAKVQELFPSHVLYSQLKDGNMDAAKYDTLIIDNIGMLSRLYRYAYISYIGGGFGVGIHNILEAAVYGRPVLFGPNHQKFAEAVELLQLEGGYSVANAERCAYIIEKLITNKEVCEAVGNTAKEYVYRNKGASEKIISFIQEKRLLTS